MPASPSLLDRPMILLATVGFFLAGIVMISKAAAVSGVAPLDLALAGNLGAGAVLLTWTSLKRDLPPRAPRYLLLYLAMGFVSFAFPNAMTFTVVEHAGPAYTATVYALSPLLTFALALMLRADQVTLLRALGLLIGLTGTVILIWRLAIDSVQGELFWLLLGLTIPASTACGNIIRSRFWPAGTSPLAFSSVTLIASVFLLLALIVTTQESPLLKIRGVEQLFWVAALTINACFFYVLLFRLQVVAGPVYLSQVGYWSTGFGILMAAILFGDVIPPASAVGIALIIAGAALTNRRR
ncbi:MAG: DMT family transporter [Pseudomonadota bacterium]